MQRILISFIVLGVSAGILNLIFRDSLPTEPVSCTKEAMICPDGSSVGREGPKCEFAPCPNNNLAETDKSNLIVVSDLEPKSVINPGLVVTGQARGYWFFEGSFPVVLTNWDGLIIAETIATAEGEWMTEDFVPFKATINFVSPYKVGDPDFMKNGNLILRKDNPSGLPEHDDALEIPISFAP